MENLSSHKV